VSDSAPHKPIASTQNPYVMLCYVMLCYVMLCYVGGVEWSVVMLCRWSGVECCYVGGVVECYVMLCYVI